MSRLPTGATGTQAGMSDACCSMLSGGRDAGVNRSPEAEDIAQETCIRALKLPQPERIRDPVRYLVRVARNLFIDRQRLRKREAALFESLPDSDIVGDGIDPERILAGKQELAVALGVIAALPPRCREAFTLHRFHDLSYAAIARQMGISTSAVEKHIAQAMLRLAQALNANGEGKS